MPDSALEATERQFSNLLAAAAGPLPVRLRFYSLPEIPRADAARARISGSYGELRQLWNGSLDALIVTGAEPRSPDLRQESYWDSLVELIEWSKANVASAVWSCLAAHAAVLHLDGVPRRALAQKCCGVFEHRVNTAHRLTRDLAAPTSAPHSRWNEVAPAALESCGYEILTVSEQAGVNLFAKQLGSLFLFWQGHPEYDERSLLKEYQRDVARFLRGERDTYPTMPYGYFDAAITARLAQFEAQARDQRREALMSEFPFEAAAAKLVPGWRAGAVQFYRHWLQTIAADKQMQRRQRA